MRVRIIILTLLTVLCTNAYGQIRKNYDSKREQWGREMYTAKCSYIIEYLDLTPEQKKEFLPMYDQMDAEMKKLRKETNQLRKSVSARNDVTDLEYEKATEAMLELNRKMADCEIKYYSDFKTVLSPKQLFKLKDADFKWFKKIAKKRGKHQDKK